MSDQFQKLITDYFITFFHNNLKPINCFALKIWPNVKVRFNTVSMQSEFLLDCIFLFYLSAY